MPGCGSAAGSQSRQDTLGLSLSFNPCPAAVEMLVANPDKINWAHLSENSCPAAVALLVANPDRIVWEYLSANTCPAAVELLALRPAGRSINMVALSRNPAIFEEVYDYPAMRAAMDPHREALAVAAGHPRRLARHLELGGEADDF